MRAHISVTRCATNIILIWHYHIYSMGKFVHSLSPVIESIFNIHPYIANVLIESAYTEYIIHTF